MLEKRTFPFSCPVASFNKRPKQDMTQKQVWTNQARSSFAMSPLSRVNHQPTPVSEIIALTNTDKIIPWYYERFHTVLYQADNVVIGAGHLQPGDFTDFHSHSTKSVALFLGSVAHIKMEIAPKTSSEASCCWFRNAILRGGDCFIQRSHGPNQPLVHRCIAQFEPYGFLMIDCHDVSIPSLNRVPLITCINPSQAKVEHKLNSEFSSTVSTTIDPQTDITLHIEDSAQYLPFCRIVCGTKDVNQIQTQVRNGVSCHKVAKQVNGANVEALVIENIQSYDDAMLTIKNISKNSWTGCVVDLYGSSSAKREIKQVD